MNLYQVHFLATVMATANDEILVGKVFNYISDKGFITFANLLAKPSPLATKFSAEEAASWIRDHLSKDKRFAVQEVDGKVTSVKIMAKVRLCFQYLEDGKHDYEGGCKYWHVCKDYIEGNCEKQCRHGLSHDFHDEENSDKCEELGFGKLNNCAVRRLVALNLPMVCSAYLQGSCDDPNCSYLHLCAGFVRRSCSDMRECNLSHNLQSRHNKFILRRHGLDLNIRKKYVLCNILVPKVQMAQNNPKDVPKKPADQAGTSKSKRQRSEDKLAVCSGSVNQLKKPARTFLIKFRTAHQRLHFQSTPHSLNRNIPESQDEQELDCKSCGDGKTIDISGSRPETRHTTKITGKGSSKSQNQTKSANHHKAQSKLQQNKQIVQSLGTIACSDGEPSLLPTRGLLPPQGGRPPLLSSKGGVPGTRLAAREKAGLRNWTGKGRGTPTLSHQDGRQKSKYQESQLLTVKKTVRRTPEVPPNDEIRQLKR